MLNQENIETVLFRLINQNELSDFYREDCQRIKNVLAYHNIDISLADAGLIWFWHSNQLDASWLFIHDDEEILSVTKEFASKA